MTAKRQAGSPEPDRGAGPGSRSAARLAAVQALYQIELSGESVEHVIADFTNHGLASEEEAAPLGRADATLFADIVRGVAARRAEIDSRLAAMLAEGWALERLETTLRAVLRAGAYELMARPDIPFPVVVNEYVNIAAAFFTGKEPAFVNGMLDRLGRETGRGATKAAADEDSAGIG
ncbi:MAG: transcription antitermination factor NusB [Alphaproteobacteria bacterium]